MPRPPFDHFRFVAPIYDRVFDEDSTRSKVAARLNLPIDGLLLDAGGGTGRVSATISNQTGGVVIVDVSRGMLQQARHKDSLRPAHAQVERLPFVDGAFERILIVDAFHHFFQHEAAARELWRVLAVGGRLVILEPNVAKWPVKLIAWGEALLLMRSRFFRAGQFQQMFDTLDNAKVVVDTSDDPFYIQLTADKLA